VTTSVGTRKRSLTYRIMAAGLLITLILTFWILQYVPLTTCPRCEGKGKVPSYYRTHASWEEGPPLTCKRCEGGGRVSILLKWKVQRHNKE